MTDGTYGQISRHSSSSQPGRSRVARRPGPASSRRRTPAWSEATACTSDRPRPDPGVPRAASPRGAADAESASLRKPRTPRPAPPWGSLGLGGENLSSPCARGPPTRRGRPSGPRGRLDGATRSSLLSAAAPPRACAPLPEEDAAHRTADCVRAARAMPGWGKWGGVEGWPRLWPPEPLKRLGLCLQGR